MIAAVSVHLHCKRWYQTLEICKTVTFQKLYAPSPPLWKQLRWCPADLVSFPLFAALSHFSVYLRTCSLTFPIEICITSKKVASLRAGSCAAAAQICRTAFHPDLYCLENHSTALDTVVFWVWLGPRPNALEAGLQFKFRWDLKRLGHFRNFLSWGHLSCTR